MREKQVKKQRGLKVLSPWLEIDIRLWSTCSE